MSMPSYDPSQFVRWIQTLDPVGSWSSTTDDRKPQTHNFSGMTPESAARQFDRIRAVQAMLDGARRTPGQIDLIDAPLASPGNTGNDKKSKLAAEEARRDEKESTSRPSPTTPVPALPGPATAVPNPAQPGSAPRVRTERTRETGRIDRFRRSRHAHDRRRRVVDHLAPRPSDRYRPHSGQDQIRYPGFGEHFAHRSWHRWAYSRHHDHRPVRNISGSDGR